MRQNMHRTAEKPEIAPQAFDRFESDDPDIPVLVVYGTEQANAAMGLPSTGQPMEIASIPHLPFPTAAELDLQFELFRRRAVVIWPLPGPEGIVLAEDHARQIAAKGTRAVGVLKPERGHSELPDLTAVLSNRLARRRARDCIRECLAEASSLALPERGSIAPRAVIAVPLTGDRGIIIQDVEKFIARQMIWVDPKMYKVMAIWCLHAWCVRHASNPFDFSPRLILLGMETCSDNDRVLRVISWLVPGPQVVTHASPQWLAELARQPKSTLLLEDWSGTFFGFEVTCALLAASGRRDGVYLSGSPRVSTALPSCFAPVAIATSAMPPLLVGANAMMVKVARPQRGFEQVPNVFGPAPEEVLQLRARLHALADDIVEKIDPTTTRTDHFKNPLTGRSWSILHTLTKAIFERNAEQTKMEEDLKACEFEGADLTLLKLLQSLSSMSPSGDVSTAKILESVNEPPENENTPLCGKRLAAKLERYGLRAATIRFKDGQIARGYRGEDIAKALLQKATVAPV